jgi:transcriptional regulator of aromatic amino acid metabolism
VKPPPKKLGVTHWSTRLLADHLKISNTSIARAWRDFGFFAFGHVLDPATG